MNSDDATTVEHVPSRQRYEVSSAGQLAGFVAYVDRDNERIFYHTEIDERFSRRGLASELVTFALRDTRDNGTRIVAVCPYIAKFLRSHHEFDDDVDPVTPAALTAVDAAVG